MASAIRDRWKCYRCGRAALSILQSGTGNGSPVLTVVTLPMPRRTAHAVWKLRPTRAKGSWRKASVYHRCGHADSADRSQLLDESMKDVVKRKAQQRSVTP